MTDTPEMVERVALAINQEVKRQWNAAPAPGREFDPESWTATGGVIDLTAIARTTIKAMREPTKAMCRAMADTNAMQEFRKLVEADAAAKHDVLADGRAVPLQAVWDAFNAGIDAALGAKP